MLKTVAKIAVLSILGVGCGGTAGNGGGTSKDGSSSGGGTSDGGMTEAADGGEACNWPACVGNLISACMPNGACTHQKTRAITTGTTGGPGFAVETEASRTCYANGVTATTTVTIPLDEWNSNAVSSVAVLKKASTICVVTEILASDGEGHGTVKNGSGTTVATLDYEVVNDHL